MNGIIPDEIKVNGDLFIRFDQDSLIQLIIMVVIAVIIILLAKRFINRA